MEDERRGRLSFADGCIRTYGAATRLMGEVWNEVVGTPMPTLPGSPKSRFREALRLYERELRAKRGEALSSSLSAAAASDPVLSDLLADGVAQPDVAAIRDIDDVPPNVFKEAIYEEAVARGAEADFVDVDLDDFLRAAMARVKRELGWDRRINVGRNRHFPRMLQWCREVEEENATDGGFGLRIMNRSGGGRVADEPEDPHGLKVRIRLSHL